MTVDSLLQDIDLKLLWEQIGILSEIELNLPDEKERNAISGVLNLLGPLQHALQEERSC